MYGVATISSSSQRADSWYIPPDAWMPANAGCARVCHNMRGHDAQARLRRFQPATNPVPHLPAQPSVPCTRHATLWYVARSRAGDRVGIVLTVHRTRA